MNDTSARIALVGHCGPDTTYLILASQKAMPGAQAVRVNDEAALQKFIAGGTGLLLINRMLDGSFPDEDGIGLIRRVANAGNGVKLMLISNYDDAQRSAVAAGALAGFGKRDIGSAKVNDLIRGAFSGVPAGRVTPT